MKTADELRRVRATILDEAIAHGRFDCDCEICARKSIHLVIVLTVLTWVLDGEITSSHIPPIAGDESFVVPAAMNAMRRLIEHCQEECPARRAVRN